MFREMRRFKQQITKEECDAVLESAMRGVLAVLGDDDYPYAIPMDFYYDKDAQKIYFHGAGEGHKIDAVKKHHKVSFCVMDEGYKNPGEWWFNIKSVVVFGKITIMEDRDEIISACRKLGGKYFPDADYTDREIKSAENRVCCLELKIDHMTGKRVKEN